MDEKTAREKAEALPSLLLPWYDKNKRDLPWRENTDPYRVWVSEIMLQQTRVEAAKEHYRRFLQKLPTVQALAECGEDELFKLWEGLGYYSRAKNLHKAAKIVAKEGFPTDAEGWRKLPGIGDYTAGAISSIAFERPSPAVDGNVVRVLSRVLGDGREQDLLRTEYAKLLAPAYPEKRRGDFTQSLMELGATVCLPSSPKCLVCPLLGICETKSDALPVKKVKPERRKSDMTLLLFYDKMQAAVCKRREGVLQGTYAFFTAERAMDEEQVKSFLRECGLKEFSVSAPKTHRHVFTHLEWNMTAYPVFTEENVCALQPPEGIVCTPFSDLLFAPVGEIEEKYSLPSAYRWCLSLLKKHCR